MAQEAPHPRPARSLANAEHDAARVVAAVGAGVDIKPLNASAGGTPLTTPAPTLALPPATPSELSQAYAFARQYAKQHTENFTVFSLLVHRSLRKHFAAVYAFCRAADDLADDNARTPLERERALVRLRRMRQLLHAALGLPLQEDPARDELARSLPPSDANLPGLDARLHTAVAHTIATKGLSPSLFVALLDAFEHDQRVTRAGSWSDLLAYSQQSANPVGRIVLQLHGLCLDGDATPGARKMLEESDAICTALQLTNFWQDVRRDLLERDRIYVPLADAGLTAEQLHSWVDRPNEPPVRRRMGDEVLGLAQRTWRLYEAGRGLPSRIPNRRVAWMVWLFAQGGEATLRAVEQGKGITLWQRPRITRKQRMLLTLRATFGWLTGSRP